MKVVFPLRLGFLHSLLDQPLKKGKHRYSFFMDYISQKCNGHNTWLACPLVEFAFSPT